MSKSGNPNIFNNIPQWWAHLRSQEADTISSAKSELSEPVGCDKEDKINHILTRLCGPPALGMLSFCYIYTCPTGSVSHSPGYTLPTLQPMQGIPCPQSSKALTNNTYASIKQKGCTESYLRKGNKFIPAALLF